jgi:hypothetical protein
MLSGATSRASDMTGTAVFRIVVSSDSIKNATATSHGRSCLLEADGGCEVALMGGIRQRCLAIPIYSDFRIARFKLSDYAGYSPPTNSSMRCDDRI